MVLASSVWNIGETIGVLDRKARRGQIPADGLEMALTAFWAENEKMIRLRALKLAPIKGGLLSKAWALTLRRHIYVADALQIVSAKSLQSDLFATGDGPLLEVAESEGLTTLNVDK